MTSLFFEASRDLEAEHLSLRLAEAKVAVAELWPFLALADSVQEFGHRLALAHERIAARVPQDLLEVTTTALKQDFADLAAWRAEQIPSTPKTAAVAEAPVQPGQQVWHVTKQAWVTVAGQEPNLPNQPDTRHNQYGNPAYFEQAAEEGPNTGSDGQFAQFPAGPDPVSPLQSMFPAQPQPWTVPPDKTWVERPMNFSPPEGGRKSGSRPNDAGLRFATSMIQSAVGSVLASAGYVDEGVQTGPGPNPQYFAGGSEGIAGDQQAGYPVDLSVEDPDSDRVNEYGGVPPQQSSGSGQGNAQPYSNPGVARQSVRHTAPGGGEHAPYKIQKGDGGYYVVNAKGERKNSEPKSKEDARQFQKALYKNVPGASESAKAASFHDPADPGVRVVAQDGTQQPMGNTPQPPPSMMPGGIGAVAPEPMPPGATSSGNAADPGGADRASKQHAMAAFTFDPSVFARMAADNIRQRPSDTNPTGVADEYDDNNWEGQANTRPRQPAQDRGINTPQTPRDPIPQASSSDFQRDLSEDERRLVQGFARRSLTGVS